MANQRAEGSHPEPAQLVRRISEGDREAEALLCRYYGPKIDFILRRRLKNPALVADLRQDTLLTVLLRLRETGIEEPEKLGAFLHATAVNLARNEARTYRRRNTHADTETLETIAAAAPSAPELVDRERLAASIRELIGELATARDRKLLRRFYLGREDKADLCRALDVTSEHFDRILYRARKRFREIAETRLGRDILGP